MIDATDAKRLILAVLERYPARAQSAWTPANMADATKRWPKMLTEIDYEQAEARLVQLCAESKYCPRYAECEAALRLLNQSQRRAEMSSWRTTPPPEYSGGSISDWWPEYRRTFVEDDTNGFTRDDRERIAALCRERREDWTMTDLWRVVFSNEWRTA